MTEEALRFRCADRRCRKPLVVQSDTMTPFIICPSCKKSNNILKVSSPMRKLPTRKHVRIQRSTSSPSSWATWVSNVALSIETWNQPHRKGRTLKANKITKKTKQGKANWISTKGRATRTYAGCATMNTIQVLASCNIINPYCPRFPVINEGNYLSIRGRSSRSPTI
jgi:hypothetical protein